MANQMAFTTLGCPGWDFESIVTRAAAMGYAAIEIRGILDELKTESIPALLPEHQARTQMLLKENNIAICGIGTSAMFHNPANTESALAEGRQALDICKRMSIPFIRVFGDAFPEGESKNDVIERVAGGIMTLCEYAESLGDVRVLMEIHGEFNTPDVLGGLFNRIGQCDAFGILWDIEHSYRAVGNDIETYFNLIRPYVRHVHAKDCVIRNDALTIVLPGEGDIDIAKVVKLLVDSDYNGYYAFEWEKRWVRDLPEPEVAFPIYAQRMREWLRSAN